MSEEYENNVIDTREYVYWTRYGHKYTVNLRREEAKSRAEGVLKILMNVNNRSKKQSNKNRFMKESVNDNGEDVLEKYFNYESSKESHEYKKQFKSALCKQILFAVSGLASRCIGDNRIGLNKTVKHHFRHWDDERLSKMLYAIANYGGYYQFFNDAIFRRTRGASEVKDANTHMTRLAEELYSFLENDKGDLITQVIRILNYTHHYCNVIREECTTEGCKAWDAMPFYGGNLVTSAFRQGRRGAYRIMEKIGLPDFMTRSGSHNLSKYDCVLDLGKIKQESELQK